MATLEERTFHNIKSIPKHNDGAFEQAVAAGLYGAADRARYAADLAAAGAPGPYGPGGAPGMTPRQKQIVQLYQPSYVSSENSRAATSGAALAGVIGLTGVVLAAINPDFLPQFRGEEARDALVYGCGGAAVIGGIAYAIRKMIGK